MARFRIFLTGNFEGSVVELPASTLAQVSALASERRFLSAEMIDVADRILVMDNYHIKGEVENDRNYDRVSKQIMGFIHGREAA